MGNANYAAALEFTDSDQACFYMDLWEKAKEAIKKDGYIVVCVPEEPSERDTQNLINLEMVRLGFEFGRMYERLGVVV